MSFEIILADPAWTYADLAAAGAEDDKHQTTRVKREAENEKQNRGNA